MYYTQQERRKLIDMLSYAEKHLDAADQININQVIAPHIDADWDFDRLYDLLAKKGLVPKLKRR